MDTIKKHFQKRKLKKIGRHKYKEKRKNCCIVEPAYFSLPKSTSLSTDLDIFVYRYIYLSGFTTSSLAFAIESRKNFLNNKNTRNKHTISDNQNKEIQKFKSLLLPSWDTTFVMLVEAGLIYQYIYMCCRNVGDRKRLAIICELIEKARRTNDLELGDLFFPEQMQKKVQMIRLESLSKLKLLKQKQFEEGCAFVHGKQVYVDNEFGFNPNELDVYVSTICSSLTRIEELESIDGLLRQETTVDSIMQCSWNPLRSFLAVVGLDQRCGADIINFGNFGSNGKKLKPLLFRNSGKSPINSSTEAVCLSWSKDGSKLAVADICGKVYVWKTVTSTSHFSLEFEEYCEFPLPDFIIKNDSTCSLDGKHRRKIRITTSLLWHSNTILCCLSEKKYLIVWYFTTTADTTKVHKLDIACSSPENLESACQTNCVAVGCKYGSVLVCSVLPKLRIIHRYCRHYSQVNMCRFNRSDTLLASASDDYTVRLYILGEQSWKPDSSRVLRGHSAPVLCIDWAFYGLGTNEPEIGQLIASGSRDETIRVTHITNDNQDQLLFVLDHLGGSVNCISFSESGKLMAATVDNGSISIWNCYNSELAYVYRNCKCKYSQLAWNGKRSSKLCAIRKTKNNVKELIILHLSSSTGLITAAEYGYRDNEFDPISWYYV
ncbi:hypothetical protein GJ496_010338 [Pomphorhynchus laevis]|nr:hypothetical protein GJ496_010338 [Pomphorhynchus laevis]